MKFNQGKKRLHYKKQTYKNSENGYVLMEALFSVVILSIGLVMTFNTFHKLVQTVHYRQHYLDPGKELADSLLIDLELNLITKNKIILPGYGNIGRFDYQIKITDWPFLSDLKQVSVTVSWNFKQRPGSFSLTSLFSIKNLTEKSSSDSNSISKKAGENL